jgi:hypothetical protein
MTLSAQKYANTFRTVGGLINTVFDSDVILLCDTSLGAVNIDLAEIPANFWNTVYKLYVVDKSNNAGVNNITIKAPLGYTVNNASTFVVNVNGGSAIVRIISNTSYVAETNYGFGSGLAVQNEGVPITPSATTMNFVGAGVNATAVGGFVTIDIAGTAVVPLTSAQLLTLIATNAVVPNTWYLVSNAIFTLTLSDTVPILVQGVTTNSVSLSGSGIFLNADYQLVGNYSGVLGFVSNLGVWQSTLITVIGSVVIWNNLQYVNTTGVNGISNPSLDAVNWTVLAKNSTNGYIQAVDDITYQASSNNILSRSDVRNNFVENNRISYATVTEAFYQFQWGNNQVQSNSVSSDSVFICLNNYVIGSPAIAILPAIFGNQVSERSQCNLQINTRIFQNNSIKQSVDLRIISNSGIIAKNDFSQNGTFILENGIGSNFGDNTICKLFQCDIHNLSNNANFVANHIESSTVNIVTNTEDFSLNRILNSTVNINVSNNNITDNVFETANFDVLTINTGSIIGNRVTTRGGLSVNQNDGQIVNNVISGNSTLSIININQNEVIGNIVRGFSLLNITTNNGFINNNEFTTQTTVSIVTNGGIINLNIASNNCIFSVEENTSRGDISENIISTSTFQVQVINKNLIKTNIVRQNSILRVDTNDADGEILQNTVLQESKIIIGSNDGFVGQSGRYDGNYLTQQSTLTLGTVLNANYVGSITSGQGSRLTVTTVNDEFGRLVTNFTVITIGTLNSRFSSLNITKGGYVVPIHNQIFELGTFDYGLSTIKCEVDMSDPTVYNPATFTLTLTISTGLVLCGEITLINGGGSTIKKITNMNFYAPTTFYSGSGTVTFDSVAVAGALPTEIVSTLGATSFAIAYNVNAQNFITFRPSIFSSIRQIDQVNIYL